MRLGHIVEQVKSQNWTTVVIEFLIVVAGIVVGVQVNDWWASRLDALKEREYLIALREDFAQIVKEMENDSADYKTIAASMVALLEASRHDDGRMSVQELNRHGSQLVRMLDTSIVSDTYSNLTGSGDLSLIESQELRNALASFYARANTIRVVSQTHELQLVNTFQPYIVRNLDYFAILDMNLKRALSNDVRASVPHAFDEDSIRRVLATAEFRNVIAIKYDITTDLVDVLAGTIRQARGVEALLTRELKARGS